MHAHIHTRTHTYTHTHRAESQAWRRQRLARQALLGRSPRGQSRLDCWHRLRTFTTAATTTAAAAAAAAVAAAIEVEAQQVKIANHNKPQQHTARDLSAAALLETGAAAPVL